MMRIPVQKAALLQVFTIPARGMQRKVCREKYAEKSMDE
jgi:hypothetical protein